TRMDGRNRRRDTRSALILVGTLRPKLVGQSDFRRVAIRSLAHLIRAQRVTARVLSMDSISLWLITVGIMKSSECVRGPSTGIRIALTLPRGMPTCTTFPRNPQLAR